MSKTSKFIVLNPVRHDGEDVAVGEPLNLTEKDAAPLVASGYLGRPNDPKTTALLADVKEKLAAEDKARKEREAQQREQEAAERKRKEADAEAEADRLQAQADAMRAGSGQTGTGMVGSTAGVGGISPLDTGSAKGTGGPDDANKSTTATDTTGTDTTSTDTTGT